MSPLIVATFVFAQALRPSECASVEGGKSAVVWQRVKAPELRRYCDRIASGLAKLASDPGMPEEALVIGAEAEKILPGRPSAMVLEGRALLRLDRAPEAYAALREAKQRNERSLDEPNALLAWARASARTGHTDEAREAYLALLPSADALAPAERSSAYVEAGMLLLAKGPEQLSEAIVTLRQARRDSYGDAQLVAVAALALALDRAGDKAGAHSVLVERPLPGLDEAIDRARQKRVLGPQTTEPEAWALVAVAAEAQHAKNARDAWHKYVEAVPSGPWTAHAKEHEAALARGGGGKR